MPSLARKHFGFPAMGSHCEIQIYDSSRINARQVARRLGEEISRLEQKYSRYRRNSLTTAINAAAGSKAGIQIDPETSALLDHAMSCFEQSEGLFDISAGLLSRAWDFRRARVPEQTEIRALQQRVGLQKLSWKDSRLHLPAGMEIDFGGIVKEYAADSSARLARELGVEHGLINLGGDFAVIGARPGGAAWSVGIANPLAHDRHHRQILSGLIATIDLTAGGLASSGDYQRYFEHEGRRYSHIINPRTGWPSAGLRAASVAAPLCTVAGSLATIALLKPEQEALAWLEQSGLPHVTMDIHGEIGGSAIPDVL